MILCSISFLLSMLGTWFFMMMHRRYLYIYCKYNKYIYINIYIYIYIYIANKVGPRIPPCGIPLVTLDLFEQNIFFSPLYKASNTRHLFALKVMTPIAGPPLHIDYIHLYYVMIKLFAMNFLIISKHSTLTSKTVWQIIYIYIYIYIIQQFSSKYIYIYIYFDENCCIIYIYIYIYI